MRVGFVGLGANGNGQARNLHRAGLLSAVWNRTSEKARALAAELGCQAPATLEALAPNVDAVVICVSADDDVLQVVRALATGMRKGTLVIDCSPSEPTRLARRATPATGRCGIPGLPVTAASKAQEATLAIMAGGNHQRLCLRRNDPGRHGQNHRHFRTHREWQAARRASRVGSDGRAVNNERSLTHSRCQGADDLQTSSSAETQMTTASTLGARAFECRGRLATQLSSERPGLFAGPIPNSAQTGRRDGDCAPCPFPWHRDNKADAHLIFRSESAGSARCATIERPNAGLLTRSFAAEAPQ